MPSLAVNPLKGRQRPSPMNTTEWEGLAEALFKEAGDALFLFDTETGQILEVNPTAERLSGFTREELLRMQTMSLLQGEASKGQQRLEEAHHHTTAFHAIDGFLLRTRQEGVWIPVNLTITRLHVKPRTLGLITVRDVRDFREAFQKIRKVEAEMRRVLTSVSDCLWSARVDADGHWIYRYFSPVAESITGRPPRFFMSEAPSGADLPFVQIVDPRDCDRWRKAHARLRSGQAIHEEYRIIRADGTSRWIRESVRVSPQEDGRGHMLDGVITDVTERKQQEEDLRSAKEAAEAANRAKGEFLAKMSHEIRTPLNGVMGMAELVESGGLNAEQHSYMQILQASAGSLLTLIDDILDVSRIESGKLELDQQPFGLRQLLGDVLGMLAIRAHQKGLELIAHVHNDVPDRLIGDPMRFRQVVVNLVNNAVKFTEVGEVCMEVRLAEKLATPAGGVKLAVGVRDTGPGIPRDKHAVIFESFSQADPSTTRKHGGSGLGLSIAAQLVQMMGGTIRLESEPGKGSTFEFTVCMSVDGAVESTRAVPRELRGLRVLICDENLGSRRVLAQLLSGWGMLPTAVADFELGGEAFAQALATGRPFDVILLDTGPPAQDALTHWQPFWRAWWARDGRAVPVVAILRTTNLGRDADRCRELGIDAYLTKPIQESVVSDILVKLLSSGRAPDRPATTPHPAAAQRSLHVLLAEDNAVNQMFAARLLELHGHKVRVANTGREALNLIRQNRFDAVLMDLEMPEMDGIAAATAIRTQEKSSGGHLPIIALTAHAMSKYRDQSLAAGMDAFLCKPVQARDLLDTLQRLCPAGANGPAPAPAASFAGTKPAPRDGVAFDREAALARCGNNLELLRTVIDAFFTESARLLSTLRQALSAGDALSAQRTAHSLKGMLGTISAQAAQGAAARIDVAARRGDLPGCIAAMPGLERDMKTLIEILRNERSAT